MARFKSLGVFVVFLFLAGSLFAQQVGAPTPPNFANNESEVYWLPDDELMVEFLNSYSGVLEDSGERVSNLNIFPAALEMMDRADQVIVATFFLFDSLEGELPPEVDVVELFAEKVLKLKEKNPELTVAFVPDPSHRSYADREGLWEDRLRKAGVDFFYSDLLSTGSATYLKLWEGLREVTRRVHLDNQGLMLAPIARWATRIPLPFRLNGEWATLRTALNALFLKANHRKMLVTDIAGSSEMQALVTSANPHNASIPSWNHAIRVRGGVAKFIYNVIREDIRKTIYLSDRGYDLARWHDDASDEYKARYLMRNLPYIYRMGDTGEESDRTPVGIQFVTENRIRAKILEILGSAVSGDHVRLQMFYLSDPDIVEEIIVTAERGVSFDLLLDPSKDAFGKTKDGTPNRQAAAYMMEHIRAAGLQESFKIRWANTHGEQNHAKSISITSESTGKYIFMAGSSNWTRRNLGTSEYAINMEANLIVYGSERIVGEYNAQFDRKFNPQAGDPIIYTVPWEKYSEHTGLRRWSKTVFCARLLKRTYDSGRLRRKARVYSMW